MPDDLLAIPTYLAEKVRQKKEAEERRQVEQQAQEHERLMEMWRQRDIEAKEMKRAEICAQLGISEKALAKLQEAE